MDLTARSDHVLSQKVYDEPTEKEKDDNTTPENPLVLLRSSFHHAYGVATDAQRIRHAIYLLLGPLQHFPLITQISQHGSPSI
jgi:hypothetical protein